jgi:plasmid stabilization system protein ParE
MHTVKFLEEARSEFQEATEWYETRSVGLGERFRDLVTKKIESIIEHPERYPKRKSNFRQITLRTFPFLIIYTFYKNEGIIIINSISHTSRNPRKKYRRKS